MVKIVCKLLPARENQCICITGRPITTSTWEDSISVFIATSVLPATDYVNDPGQVISPQAKPCWSHPPTEQQLNAIPSAL